MSLQIFFRQRPYHDAITVFFTDIHFKIEHTVTSLSWRSSFRVSKIVFAYLHTSSSRFGWDDCLSLWSIFSYLYTR